MWYVEIRNKTSTSSYQKVENLWKRDYINSCIKSKIRRKLANLQKAYEKKVSKFKFSELATSFSTSSPGYLAFRIALMTTSVFFVINIIGDYREVLTKLSPDRQFLIPKENKGTKISVFSHTLKVLEDSWGNVRGLQGTGDDNFPRIPWSHFQIVWEKETHIG